MPGQMLMPIMILTTMMITIIIIDDYDHEEDGDTGESMNKLKDFNKTLRQFFAKWATI